MPSFDCVSLQWSNEQMQGVQLCANGDAVGTSVVRYLPESSFQWEKLENRIGIPQACSGDEWNRMCRHWNVRKIPFKLPSR